MEIIVMTQPMTVQKILMIVEGEDIDDPAKMVQLG
jgi:hypothetical protein